MISSRMEPEHGAQEKKIIFLIHGDQREEVSTWHILNSHRPYSNDRDLIRWRTAELWGEATMQRILRLVGDLMAMDDSLMERRCLDFARACIKLDLGWPLKPGLLIDGPEGPCW